MPEEGLIMAHRHFNSTSGQVSTFGWKSLLSQRYPWTSEISKSTEETSESTLESQLAGYQSCDGQAGSALCLRPDIDECGQFEALKSVLSLA
jgi:hypothetical protein